ncbi:feruloyl esterase [Sphingomonas vulcanisoli]|uniref:Feruloyl esterase n=1 Tax=Sphingomonas vulcanisoli TaxID=1658060 RepID=A0ABX0TV18_9SPHN|nr:tannase/feruloyl esterase family alpha/beta hydrolase [Sphingomonas vulcanisoli]NIJ08534.1 feruloyl esterase [Sphingomonas vulcanisoli]
MVAKQLLGIAASVLLGSGALAAPVAAQPTPAPLTTPPTISAGQCSALAAYATSRGTENALKKALAQLPEAPTSIMQAQIVAAHDDVPEVCQVNGIVAPSINFELRMPTTKWNGRFMHYGCGGACGIIYRPQLEEPLARGYAVVASDMGHTGAPNNWTFDYGNVQALIDFSYRATHVVTLAAKEVVKAAYGLPAKFSYMYGCSTGGLQGQIEAQRYPHDFDGIVSGSPVYLTGPNYSEYLVRANLDANGNGIFDPDKLPMLRKAVLAECDAKDGLKDGVLQDPRKCGFDPATLLCKGREAKTCLTSAEVAVVRKMYAGPVTADGKPVFYGWGGMLPGSEYEWYPSFIGDKGKPHPRAMGAAYDYGSGIYPLTAATLATPYGHDDDYTAARGTMGIYPGGTLNWLRWAGDPDLRRFRDAGGKIITWHGWDDSEAAPGVSTDYHETMARTMGGEAEAQKFSRLFMLPGVAHCRRGPGGDSVDWISAIEAWVEQGKAPDQVIAHHLVKEQNYLGLPRPRYPLPAGSYDRTRPVYPYPLIARYKGTGDANDAANWRPGSMTE